MNAHACPREQDTLDAVAARRWPGRDDNLSAHIASCGVCADLAAVAAALRDDWDAAPDVPPLPAAELIWWRAQVRERTEAARLAARPIAVVQWVSAATAAGVALALTTFAKAPVTDAARWFTTDVWSWIPRLAFSAEAATLVLPAMVLGIGVWLALVPVAVFLASDD
jgi:hypothetical protein